MTSAHGRVGMLSKDEIEKTIQYITDRRCNSGGYCFYQLDEPNLSDTWYALGCLMVLGRIESDPVTETYLYRYQPDPSGSVGLYRLWYLFWSYRYLTGEVPSDLISRLYGVSPPIPNGTGTMETSSVLEQLYCYTILCTEAEITLSIEIKEEIVQAVNRCHHSKGGFGREKPTLIETRYAVAILRALGVLYPFDSMASFLIDCTDIESGFANVSSSHPGYLEHLDAGLSLVSLLDKPISVTGVCSRFIEKCRNENGGYNRSGFGGNASLEYTWYAIRSLSRLNGRNGWRW